MQPHLGAVAGVLAGATVGGGRDAVEVVLTLRAIQTASDFSSPRPWSVSMWMSPLQPASSSAEATVVNSNVVERIMTGGSL
jgi:hypothetical protein